jgi:hypothetical protein
MTIKVKLNSDWHDADELEGVFVTEKEFDRMTADQLREVISDYIDSYNALALVRWNTGSYEVINYEDKETYVMREEQQHE